ncbi:uncharacterized protein LOC100185187 [Ciona intestinalis]
MEYKTGEGCPSRDSNSDSVVPIPNISQKFKCNRFLVIFGLCALMFGGLALILVITWPVDPGIAASETERLYLSREFSSPLFTGGIQIEKLDSIDVVWDNGMGNSDDSRRKAISRSLTAKLQSAFEIEGFVITEVEITSFEPVTVDVYSILGRNLTTLTLPASLTTGGNRTDEITVVHLGKRQIIRIAYECFAMPSKNVKVGSQVGAVEAGSIQFMLGSYLANREVIALVETIEVLDSFKKSVKSALRAVPRLATEVKTNMNNDAKPASFITCHKTGAQIDNSNSIFRCPANCRVTSADKIVGHHWYHIASSVCLAAIHAGAIQKSKGGTIEFLKVGNGFVFEGLFANGINSTTKVEYAERFIVKSQGPSWIAKPTSGQTMTLLPIHTFNFHQSYFSKFILFTVKFILLQMDGTNIRFSLIGIQSYLANKLRKDVVVKVRVFYPSLKFSKSLFLAVFSQTRASFEVLNFRFTSATLSALEPLLHDANSVRVTIDLYGNFKANAWPMFSYKPWEDADIRKLHDDVSEASSKWQISFEHLDINLNSEFMQLIEVIPSTTGAPITNYPGKCGCGEIYFIHSIGPVEHRDSIRNFYNHIFNMFNFDQLDLGFGLAVLRTTATEKSETEIVTKIGQDLSVGALRRLDEVLKEGDESDEDITREELWRVLDKLEKESSFMRKDLQTRKKLLIISSRFVFGPAASTNIAYLDRVKRKGIQVAYIGYNWDEELLKAHYYPQMFASQPASDFVKHVRSIGDVDSLTSFVSDIIKKQICNSSPQTCANIEFLIQPPDDLTFDSVLTINDTIGSYMLGVPVGTGLKQYKPTGGLRYNNVDLPSTSAWRKTVPGPKQAFYNKYQCGVQANQPAFPTGRIVGGSEAVPHSWPWAVSINLLRSKIDSKTKLSSYYYNFWKCGGTIIHNDWIVTAAHCFANKNELVPTTNYVVAVGRHDQNDLTSLPGDVYEIKRIVYHPDYDDPSNKFDVALLQLKRSITYRREVAPACLPNPDVIPSTGGQCWLVGWGYTSNEATSARNKLKQAVQVIESPGKCQQIYKRYYYDPNTNLCSKRSESDNVNMQCRGDSGGPLVCFENERWVLYGVSNFGPKLCENGGESGYFLLSSVLDWLCCYIEPRIGPCAYVKCSLGVS